MIFIFIRWWANAGAIACLRFAAAIVFLLLPIEAALAQSATRVVSANLCADQLVLALADPGQIVSLGPFAREEALSFLFEEAKKYPANRGSAEEMIGLKADLVLLGSFDSRYARAVLQQQHIPFMSLEPWTDIEQGRRQIRAVADRLGQQQRGEALIARIDAGIGKLEAIASSRITRASVLVLHRRGYALHSGVTAELARLAGLSNAADALGLKGSGLIQMERVVATPPDYLIVTQEFTHPADQGEAVLAHPALTRLFSAGKRLVVPDRLAICAGPSTPALIEAIASEIRLKIP